MKLVSLEETKKLLQDATFPIPQDVLNEMFKIMEENKGIGLAAPQVGYYQKFFIMKLGNERYVVANPAVMNLTGEYKIMEEGCLTLPGQWHWVPRFHSIRMVGFDEDGSPLDWFCKGRMAQVVQHEVMHLKGICISDQAVSKEGGK